MGILLTFLNLKLTPKSFTRAVGVRKK